jgi:hypothetical protein
MKSSFLRGSLQIVWKHGTHPVMNLAAKTLQPKSENLALRPIIVQLIEQVTTDQTTKGRTQPIDWNLEKAAQKLSLAIVTATLNKDNCEQKYPLVQVVHRQARLDLVNLVQMSLDVRQTGKLRVAVSTLVADVVFVGLAVKLVVIGEVSVGHVGVQHDQ